MRAPKRIQRKRTKGWKMPEGAVYVGRGSPWGNPFVIGQPYFIMEMKEWMAGKKLSEATWRPMNRDDVIHCYERWLREQTGPSHFAMTEEARVLLKGHDLACWCALDEPCHADVLLELANR